MLSPIRLRPATTIVALASGLLLIADVAVITAIDDSFGLLDSGMFLTGFAGLILTGALVGALSADRFSGARRAVVAISVFVLLVALLTAVSIAADGLSHTLYHGGNRGIRKECGIFVLGLAALAIGSLLHRPRLRRPLSPSAPWAGSGSR